MIYPNINELSDTMQLEGEEWKDVLGWEGFYQVSCRGRVKRLRREVRHSNQAVSFEMVYPEKILKANPDSRGYPQVTLNGKHFGKKRRVARVHRLVAEAHLPNPEGKPQVNHINGDVKNACSENLEWCTASENQLHAYELGLREGVRGEKSGMNKHSVEKVKLIYQEAKARTMSQEKIGIKYGVPQITVSNILTKRTWKHITDKLDLEVH